MNARALTKWAAYGLLILPVWLAPLCTSPEEKNGQIGEQPANTIVMDDGFEYRLIDYGFGRLQLRDDQSSLSAPVFWMEFSITNTSEHLLRGPRHSPTNGWIKINDNWGNTYEARSALAVYGVDWKPLLQKEGGLFKPGEARSEMVETSASGFVEDIHEFRAYLKFPYYVHPLKSERYQFFVLREPMSRHRDWLRNQPELPVEELQIATGSEIRAPSRTSTRRQSPARN